MLKFAILLMIIIVVHIMNHYLQLLEVIIIHHLIREQKAPQGFANKMQINKKIKRENRDKQRFSLLVYRGIEINE
jgi:hypothetical protein